MEIITVEVEGGTRRRLEMLGFPHDLAGRDVLRFLIEEGLGVLEGSRKERHAEPEHVAA
jgi:hypothetical protein